MLFAEGCLSETECHQLDQLANDIVARGPSQEESVIKYEHFLLLAKKKLNIELEPMPLKYVFRLN